jgi:2-iminobutanoate/2-iminopropanoate deaminase
MLRAGRPECKRIGRWGRAVGLLVRSAAAALGQVREQLIMRRSARLLLFSALCQATALALGATPPEAGGASQGYVEHHVPPGAPALPFSDAVLTGNTLYVAGHIGIDARTGNAAADPVTEARLVMEAVKHTVEAAGLHMDDLASVTVYCTDLKLYDTFNRVYSGYFHGHYPARAFIGAAQLVRGAHFEVAGIAVKPPRPSPL